MQRNKRFRLMHNKDWIPLAMMLSLLSPVLSGCAGSSTAYVSSQANMPELSHLARQPERSSLCLPNCSTKATTLIDGQQKKLTSITMLD